MNALPAVAFDRKGRNPARLAKKVKAKVIKLKLAKKKATTLSPKARENMVLEYRPKARKLARSMLRKWHSRLDLEEVDSVVDLSLCEAIRRFNPSKGASFMTFLFYHLRGNLIRTVSAAANAKCVPFGDSVLVDSVMQGSEHSRQTLGAGSANAIEVAEALCNHEYPLPDEVLYRKEMVQLSHGAFDKLDSLEREVIQKVYLEEQQLVDIAHKLGYSRCHISRVKKKALETLFEELRNSSGNQDVGSGPIDEAEDSESLRRPLARRTIQRRRPKALRSKATAARQTHAAQPQHFDAVAVGYY